MNDSRTIIGSAADRGFVWYIGGRIWREEASKRKCEIASRRTLPGVERRLFCRTCLGGEIHSCSQAEGSNFSLSAEQRVIVSYPPAPGIEDGKFESCVISVRGHVAKLYFHYDDDTEDASFFTKLPEGGFCDLAYDLPTISLPLNSHIFIQRPAEISKTPWQPCELSFALRPRDLWIVRFHTVGIETNRELYGMVRAGVP